MRNLNFKEISVADINAMAELLEARQRQELSSFPFLDNKVLKTEYVIENVTKLVDNETVIGLCAYNDDLLLGYLIGEIRIDAVRGNGRHIWVPYEGVAIREGQSAELLRTLYSEVSLLWNEKGCFNHIINIPLGKSLYLDALMRLSFSIDHVHGIMKLSDYNNFKTQTKIDIRKANIDDSDKLGNLSNVILSALNATPTYLAVVPETIDQINKGFKRLPNDSDSITFLAEEDNKAVGFQVFEAVDSNLMIPDNSIELSIAGTLYSHSSKGIGKFFMNHTCEYMRNKGHDYVVSDWKMSNLSASRFWSKCGFTPIAYRMCRLINKDITWAKVPTQ